MRKLISAGKSLLQRNSYSYIPVSNYEVQKKQNPVIEVTLGDGAGRQLEIHFRVTLASCSSSKTPSPAPQKISGDFSSALLPTKAGHYLSLTTTFSGKFPGPTLSWAIWQKATAPSSDPLSAMSRSNCRTTVQAC